MKVGRQMVGLGTAMLLLTACNSTAALPSSTVVAAETTTTNVLVPASTTTVPATTTTLDRIAEVQAIIQDLEERRLDALYRGDMEAFRSVFASEGYYELSLQAADQVVFVGPPVDISVVVEEILVDSPSCLAFRVYEDLSTALGPEAVGSFGTTVLTPLSSGEWGFAYSGNAWLCEGPNPADVES